MIQDQMFSKHEIVMKEVNYLYYKYAKVTHFKTDIGITLMKNKPGGGNRSGVPTTRISKEYYCSPK